MAMNPLRPVTIYGRMIKFSHSVFALPFALSGAALAASVNGITVSQIAWIIVAMVSARSAAMGFNRIADRYIDAANPRTSARELPTGLVSVRAGERYGRRAGGSATRWRTTLADDAGGRRCSGNAGGLPWRTTLADDAGGRRC